ncbi:substrate-binding domain-containing protein [Microvirga tunisiensis]|uniref:substrate-binding domain-containing protein n=1 Tax=Microvirga tunisiensis TaxID=2108360 RepID=UPI0013868DFB
MRSLFGGAAILALAGMNAPANAADPDFSQYIEITRNAQTTPSWPGPTEPAPAPKNKFIVEISCTHAVEGCKKNSEAIEDVAKRLGWRYKIIVVSDATGFDAAVMTGINAGADGIILNGIDTKLISGGIASAKAKMIPIVSPQLLNEVGPYGVDADVSSDAAEVGKIIAAEAIANHNGKMHVLMLNIAEWQLPARIMKGVKATLDGCSKCQITYATPIDFTSSVIGTTLPQQVVAAIRRDPKINVIIEGIDPMANFIIPALDAAGMRDKVKMYSSLANPGPLQLMREGNVLVADVGVSLKWGVWGAIDQMIRIMNGQPTVHQVVPVQLLTMEVPDSLPAPGTAYTSDASGFAEKYLTLWGIK